MEEATGSIAHYILQLSTQDSVLGAPLRFGRGEKIWSPGPGCAYPSDQPARCRAVMASSSLFGRRSPASNPLDSQLVLLHFGRGERI